MSDYCEYEELLSLQALGALGDEDARALQLHLDGGCKRCRELFSGFDTVAAVLADLVVPLDPSPEVGRRLKRLLRRDGDGAGDQTIGQAISPAAADNDHQLWDELATLDGLGSLAPHEQQALAVHIDAGCEVCRERIDRNRDVGELLATMLEPLEPSLALSDRVKNIVRGASSDSAPTQAVLVGREAEMAILQDRVSELREGEGCVVSIEAEAGLGKSRLAAETVGFATEQEVAVWTVRATPIARTLSYGPFAAALAAWAGIGESADEAERAQGLERAVRAIAAEDGGEIFPFLACLAGIDPGKQWSAAFAGMEVQALERRIHQSLRCLLEHGASRVPLMLVIEDLHWADDSTVALLKALLPVVETHAVMLVLLMRPQADGRQASVAAFADEHLRLRHHRIGLDSLDQHDSLLLARELLGADELPEAVAQLVRGKADGNPFYIEELIRNVLQSGAVEYRRGRPVVVADLKTLVHRGGIGAVIMSRVQGLTRSARSVLEIASVVGRRFQLRVLEQVVGSVESLEEDLQLLERMHFVLRSDVRDTSNVRVSTLHPERAFVFKHALVQELVLESLAESRRRELHARCAAAIEELFAERLHDHYGVLAYQYSRAGLLEQANDYLMRAGELAAASAASADALYFFREAYSSYHCVRRDGGEVETRARLERNIALALLNTGNLGESIAHFDAALRLYGEWVPRSRVGRTFKAIADLAAVLARLYSGSLARSGRTASERERILFELLYNRCRAQNIAGDERRAFDNLAAIRHVGHLDASSVDNATGILSAAGAFFAFSGISFDPSHRFLALGEDLAQRGGYKDMFLHKTMAFVVSFLEGDWSSRHDIDADLFERGLRYGLLWDADVYLGMLCERNIYQGNYARAAEQIERFASLCDDWGYEFSRSNQYAATAYLLFGQRRLDEAQVAAERWRDLRGEDSLRLLALGLLARIQLLRGRLDDAEATLAQAEGLRGGDGGIVFPYYDGICSTARLALEVAKLERTLEHDGALKRDAIRAARRCGRQALASSRKCARDRGDTLRLVGRLEWLAGKSAAALGYWQQAREECIRLGARAELARTWADMGAALAAADADAVELAGVDAAQCFEHARGLFVELGCQWDLERLALEARRRRRAA